PETIAAIQERNQLDSALYSHASQLFAERFGTMVHGLLEREFDEQYRQHPVTDASPVRLSFDQALYGSGWQARERWGTDIAFRWTGPQTTSTLDLPLALHRRATLRFRILAAIAPDVLDSLSLSVNGIPVALTRRQDAEGGALFEGVITPSALSGETL